MKNRKDDFLQRRFNTEIRAEQSEEQKNVIEGTAVVLEQETRINDGIGEFIEIIRAGALDDTDLTDVRLLVNHDMNGIPLARSRRNNKSDKPNTMQLSVDENGLNIKATLDVDNNEQARAVYSAIEHGDMDGMSFCFYVSEDNQEWSERDGMLYREIKKIDKIVEVSVVSFPAYQGTSIDTRSLESDRNALERAKKLLENNKQKAQISARAKAIIKMYKEN